MQRLRDPNSGCAWDREQTFHSIAAYTLEEAYEVVDAIERSDLDGLKDELGDLLLQVVFHAQIAKEQNAFRFDDVVDGIVEKMVRRHPHVFGDVQFNSTAELKASWEAEKARERSAKSEIEQSASNESVAGELSPSALDGIAMALPSLKRADKIQKRVSRENRNDIEDELGDLLFSVVNLARYYEIDAEMALMRANEKFSARFKGVEKLALKQGADMYSMTLAELDALWDEVKKHSL